MSPLWSDMALARATAAKAGLGSEQPRAEDSRPSEKQRPVNPVRHILRSKRASFAL